MERRKFLGTLSAPVFTACAVCLAGCGKSSDTPGTGGTGGGGGGGNANMTIDLNSSLTTVGSSVIQSGVIVVRLATGNTPASFSAVQSDCTHAGTTITFNASQNQFVCPNHGSTFATSGAVTLGPASKNLKVYTITISGNTMTVSG